MPCYFPLEGYKSRTTNPSGKRSIVFNPGDGFKDMPVTVACGQCIGCRLERSRQWAMRCVHESQLYEDNCFLTLTYDNDHLPPDLSLNKKHFQDFMKRFRKFAEPRKIRFFHCGEYGELYGRPHYHAIIFNYDFQDKVLYKQTGSGSNIFISESLINLWPFGYSSIGDVTFDSAAYVARYIMKKVTGDDAEDHYKGREPEYITMSRRPGIGTDWFNSFSNDVYPRDIVIINGKKVAPPKFYDRLYEIEDAEEFKRVKNRRMHKIKDLKEPNTDEVLRRKYKHKKLTIERLVRPLE